MAACTAIKNSATLPGKLRNNSTPAEDHLWHFLKAERLGVKFRRQAAIGPYIVDIVCFTHRLILELDGPQHLDEEMKTHDARRTAFLESRGFRVMRFRNQELDDNIDGVVEAIERELKAFESIDPLPSPPRKGEGAEPGIKE